MLWRKHSSLCFSLHPLLNGVRHPCVKHAIQFFKFSKNLFPQAFREFYQLDRRFGRLTKSHLDKHAISHRLLFSLLSWICLSSCPAWKCFTQMKATWSRVSPAIYPPGFLLSKCCFLFRKSCCSCKLHLT